MLMLHDVACFILDAWGCSTVDDEFPELRTKSWLWMVVDAMVATQDSLNNIMIYHDIS